MDPATVQLVALLAVLVGWALGLVMGHVSGVAQERAFRTWLVRKEVDRELAPLRRQRDRLQAEVDAWSATPFGDESLEVRRRPAPLTTRRSAVAPYHSSAGSEVQR